MNWIESSRSQAREAMEREAQKQREAERLKAEAERPAQTRREIAQEFLSHFIPIIKQIQSELHQAGYKNVCFPAGNKQFKYSEIRFGYTIRDTMNPYESVDKGDTDTGSTWRENYCLSVRLGELGELSLIPTGTVEDGLGVCCALQLPGNPIKYSRKYLPIGTDLQLVDHTIKRLIGESIEIIERYRR